MARQSPEAALRAQKERRQKIFIGVGLVVLLGLLAWQGPKTYKALRGGSPPPLPVATTTTPLPAGATTGGTGAQASGGDEALPDTDLQPGLLDGQLLSFSRFSGRDPFVTPAPSEPTGTTTDAAEQATIEVNGTSEDLAVGDQFPADDPTFKLVSLASDSAKIGLVSGTFSNGDETITINVGETLVLVADDGTRYAIKLVSVAA